MHIFAGNGSFLGINMLRWKHGIFKIFVFAGWKQLQTKRDTGEEETIMSRVITISREFGSGGREVGFRLAEKLGIPFYEIGRAHV